MSIYFGKSEDGSDMKEFEGVLYLDEVRNIWSNMPITKEQRTNSRTYNEVVSYMNDNRLSLNDIYNQIKNKSCLLNKRCREFVLSHYNEDGTFKQLNK